MGVGVWFTRSASAVDRFGIPLLRPYPDPRITEYVKLLNSILEYSLKAVK